MLDPRKRQSYLGSGSAWAMVADVVTGTFLWGGLGYLLDRWIGTQPWFMIIGFIVGHAAGIYAALLHMRRMRADNDQKLAKNFTKLSDGTGENAPDKEL